MAKVRFIGDPNQREHRDGTEFAGVKLPIGEWVEMDDAPVRKLSRNDHFEVAELPEIEPAGDELAELRLDFAELAQDREELIAAYRERGEALLKANARIEELEAQIAAMQAAQGETDGGSDANGPRDEGVAEDRSARSGATRGARGSRSRPAEGEGGPRVDPQG